MVLWRREGGACVVGVTVGAEMMRGMCMARARGDTESGGRGGKSWRSGIAKSKKPHEIASRSRRRRCRRRSKFGQETALLLA